MANPVASAPNISLKVRRLETSDVEDYRELRLEGLKGHPEAFASSWEHEADKPLSWWAERLKANTVFGGWLNSSRLVGVAGFRVRDAVKLQHKGVLWGMYVRPEARGTGLAAALVQQVVEHARTLVEEVCLMVVTSNAAARRLYSAAGFKEFGLERRLGLEANTTTKCSWSSRSRFALNLRREIDERLRCWSRIGRKQGAQAIGGSLHVSGPAGATRDPRCH